MAWSPLICAFSGALSLPQPSVSVGMQTETISVGGGQRSPQSQEVVRLEDVVVVGRRGAARLPPEIELNEDEIDNLGAYDIGEAVTRLGENLGFTAAPVIIVNGRQVVNAQDFMRFPPDALVRVEVLPQQAAATYGEDPSRPVLNIVLQPTFKSRDGFLKASRPTAGGNSSLSADARQSEILNNDTRQFGLQVSRDTALRAEERATYIRDHPGSEGVTLRPAGDSMAANFSMTRALGDWSSSLSATARTRRDRFTSILDEQAVETRRKASGVNVSGGLSGEAMGWTLRLGLQGQASNASQDGVADTRSHHLSIGADLSVNRMLMELPAGRVLTTLSGRYARSRNVNEAEGDDTRLSAQALDLRGNLTVPLARRTEEGASLHWGDVSLALGGTLTGIYDDAGQGSGLNANLSWSPLRKLSFNGLLASSTDSPAAQMRFDPVYYGPPRVVFDFLTGESVEVLPLMGGNPDLKPQTSNSFSVSGSAGPFTKWGVQGRLGFQRTQSRNGFGIVPDLTPAVEAAFPDRFTRDAEGRLIGIDQRPINLGSTLVETLSSGLNFNIPSWGESRDTWQVGINHTWQLTSVAALREGLPELDRLAGDGGGTPRHQISVQLNGRYGKLGVNAAARWQEGTRIRRDVGQDGPDDILRDPFSALDLKFSYLLERTAPPAEGSVSSRRDTGIRLELEVDNLFDARPEATLGDGRPATGYGRDDQDPLGRVVRLTVSRRF